MSTLRKIPAQELKQGMYLHGLCGSWFGHPYWRSQFLVESEHIRSILDSGIADVLIDEDLGIGSRNGFGWSQYTSDPDQGSRLMQDDPPATGPVTMPDEVARAQKICSAAHRSVQALFTDVRLGKPIAMHSIVGVVDDIAQSIARHPDAMIAVVRAKRPEDYITMHPVAVCTLMIGLARQLQLNAAYTREAGMAGLLHDIGKVAVPEKILNKAGELDAREMAIIKKHPVQGHATLTTGGQVSVVALEMCLHHHERIDGSGYPHGLKGDQISMFARMGAVCDAYDAMTSNRPYKKGCCPAAAIEEMSPWSAKRFDQNIFDAFVAVVGIYPVGSLLRLTSGKLAVVVEQSPKSLFTPKVKAFFSTRSGQYITPGEIDLSRTMHDTNPEEIVCIEDPDKWHIKNFGQMWAP